MRRHYAGFLALAVLAGPVASQCENLPCEPLPLTNNLWTLNDYGGFSVAVDGDVAVAGAPGEYGSLSPFGAAYVYERQPSGEWVAVTRLEKASPGTPDTQFGFSVDIVGDTILVGDPLISAPGIAAGAAYVYERPAGGWADLDVDMDGIRDAPLTENAMLVATAVGGPPATNAQVQCGHSVALSADGATAYVGTPFWHDQMAFSGERTEGRVLVFRRPGASWGTSGSAPTLNEVAQLGRSETLPIDFTSVGWSVDVIAHSTTGRDRVVAGGVADNAASTGSHHGVWVWDEPADTGMGTWEGSVVTQYGTPVTLVPAAMSGPDPFTTRHSFGEDVSFLDEMTIAVGSPSEQGVHVYTETAPDTWEQEGPLIQPCVPVNPFGTAVAFAQNGTLLVGTGLGWGVFTYERVPDPDMMNPTGMMWTGLNRILPRVTTRLNSHFAGGFNSEFGRSLAVSGGTCLAGMPTGYPGQPQRPGTVYELDLDCMCVTPDASLTNWWTGDVDFVDLATGMPGTPIGDTARGPALAESGFNFDSSGDAVDLGTAAGNFGTGDFTAELWCALNPEGSNLAYSVWLEKHDGTQGWWLDNISFGSQLRLVVGSGGDLFEISGPLSGSSGGVTYELFAGAYWSHVAVTREGMTYTLYWNGEVIAQGDDDVVLDLSSTAPLYLGGNQSLSGSVNGQLDEVSLYDRALSQAEIGEIVFAYGAAKCKDLDFIPPAITITSPMDGDVVHGLVDFNADVTDAGSGVEEVRFLVDGVQVGSPQTGPPFGVSLDTSDYDDGLRILTVEATDGDGNVGSDYILVTFDNTPPTVVVTTPMDLATVGGVFDFQAAVTDGAGSGLTSVSMLVNGMAPNVLDDSIVFDPPELATARRSRVDSYEIVRSTVTLRVTATDDAGHETMAEVTVTISNPGGRTRRHGGSNLPDVDYGGDTGFLVVDGGRGPVTALVPLLQTRLELSRPHAFELRIPGGAPLRALAHRVLLGDEPRVMLAFDRRQLYASLAEGITTGMIRPRAGIQVELTVDGVLMGAYRMRSGPDGERGK